MLALLAALLLAAVHCGLGAENRTSRLYNPIVQLVNFPNHPCSGSSTRYKKKNIWWSQKYLCVCVSLTGTCYSPEECAAVAGSLADGKCAQGFGVCCIVRCVDTV